MPLASSNKTGRNKVETLKGPRRKILLLDYSKQGGWGMAVFLKGCNHIHVPPINITLIMSLLFRFL